MSDRPRLLFVYNADGGLFNTMADIGHKIFSPRTYQCDLCALTHGYFTERKSWRAFVESLEAECGFFHRDEFHQRHPEVEEPLPAVFRLRGNKPVVCLNAESLKGCNDLSKLQHRISLSCLSDPHPDRP